jgi:hypothetical protein
MMLTDFEKNDTKERWFEADTRACYFADRCAHYIRLDNYLTWSILLFSSGAVVSAIGCTLSQKHAWVNVVLIMATAVLSLLSTVANNQKRSWECSELHFNWNRLANYYEALWHEPDAASARAKFQELIERGAELSKAGATIPYRRRVMNKWSNVVKRNHSAS